MKAAGERQVSGWKELATALRGIVATQDGQKRNIVLVWLYNDTKPQLGSA